MDGIDSEYHCSVIFIQAMALLLQNGLGKTAVFAYAALALGWFMVPMIFYLFSMCPAQPD